MTKQSQVQTGDRVTQDDAPTLRVFVAFEDQNTRVQAWQLYRHLAEDLAKDLELTSAFCDFEALGDKLSGNETILAAAEADLILFSMRSGSGLPQEIKSWIESWVPKRRTEDGGLFLLFEHSDNPAPNQTAIQSYLREVARRAGMDFLSQTVPPPMETELVSANQAGGWKFTESHQPAPRLADSFGIERVMN
jgi:hypothetical protein